MRTLGALLLLLVPVALWATQPVVIEAKKLVANNKQGWARFEGSVKAVRDGMTIHCDRMVVYTRDGKIRRIEAYGHVVVNLKDRMVKSEKAIYYAKEDKVIFEGNPQVWQGDNLVKGKRIIYFLKDERTVVESGDNGTVKAVITPKEERSAGGSGP